MDEEFTQINLSRFPAAGKQAPKRDKGYVGSHVRLVKGPHLEQIVQPLCFIIEPEVRSRQLIGGVLLPCVVKISGMTFIGR